MKSLLAIAAIAALVFCGWGTVRIVNDISFKQDCGGYLSRASNANTVDLASRELTRALEYIERNEMTSGYTSVLWRTPDEDVGYWYENLKASSEELKTISPESSQLERTNVLMKLRETLTHNGESGTYVTTPDGISVFPNNSSIGWIGAISLTAAVVFLFLAVKDEL